MGTPYSIPGVESFQKQSLTQKCLLSLSFSFFGAEHSQWNITRQGMRLYGLALQELNDALSDLVRVQSTEVLDSVMLMSLYEVSRISMRSQRTYFLKDPS